MTKPTIGPGINEPFNAQGDFLAKVTFYREILFNGITKLDNILFQQVFYPNGTINTGLL